MTIFASQVSQRAQYYSIGNKVPQSQKWDAISVGGFGNSYVVRPKPLMPTQEELRYRNDKVEYHQGKRTLDDVVQQLKGLPFYRWEFGDDYDAHNRYAEQHGGNRCCAVHAIGLPENKPELPRGFFPYEKQVFDATEANRFIWIKKATGLGISEFYLYYFLWEACNKAELKNTYIGFITGPRIELTVMLMDRLKKLPIFHDVSFGFKSTVFEINGVHFEAYPSNDLRGARGIARVSRWFLDEADFWEKRLQSEARAVAERYIAKYTHEKTKIFMVSTPYMPNGLFDTIEHEDPCRYHRIFLHYSVGVGYIYTPEDIESAKLSPSFEREYGLQYQGQVGDVFNMDELKHAIEVLGPLVNYANPNVLDLKCMGVDPGYAKSKYAIVITNYNTKTRLVEIIFAAEFDKRSTGEMVERTYHLFKHFNVTQMYIDASQNGIIRDLKGAFKERIDYELDFAELKKEGKTPSEARRKVIPVSFGPPTGDEMISKAQILLHHQMIAIPDVFRDLIVQLRSASKDENGKLEKDMLTMDLFDAFRAAIFYYNPYSATAVIKRKRDANTIVGAQATTVVNSQAPSVTEKQLEEFKQHAIFGLPQSRQQ